MQINLIPKTREQEQKKKQVNNLVFVVAVVVLASVGILAFILYSINLAREAEIKGLEEKIAGNKKEAENYNLVREKTNFIITGMTGIDDLLRKRKDWVILYSELQNLMPREAYLADFSMGSEEGQTNKIFFKTRARSVSKVAEFIESLRTYEIEIPESPETEEPKLVNLTTLALDDLSGDDEDNQENQDKEIKTKKIKLFTEIKISNYSKDVSIEGVFYYFEVEAIYVEELWTKKK